MDRRSLWVYSTAALIGLAGLARFRHQAADLLYAETHCYQGVRTNAAAQPSADCFTVSTDGTFSRVFSRPASASAAGSGSGSEATEGYVIPGLWDGHGHLLQYGEFLNSVDLFGSADMDDMRARVRRHLAENPGVGTKDEWVRGVGWDQMALGRMPTADDLAADPELKDLYIMLDRVDVHCIWVSQPVLDLLPEHLPDVAGGDIVREPGMGVFCDNAMDVVMAVWPRPGADKKKRFVRSAMAELNKVGLVGMHDAGVTPGNLRLFRSLAEGGAEDGWTVRVYAMVECDERNTFCPGDVEKYEHPGGFLSIRSVKLFGDGALGSWGSAMLDPYTDRPDVSGSLLVNASELAYVTAAWAGQGYQVNIHAIGDLANRQAIDAMTVALRLSCPPAPPPSSEGGAAIAANTAAQQQQQHLRDCQSSRYRFRIEHAQIIHPADQARMRALGVIPSIQPTHATSDKAYAEARLGPQRTAERAYRMRSLLSSSSEGEEYGSGGGGGGGGGAPVVLGSDFPVEPPSPFAGMFAAVTRKSPGGGEGEEGEEGWYAEQEALTLAQAFRGFTEAPARAGFMEGRAGVIRPGAWADWVVLDRPLPLGGGEEEDEAAAAEDFAVEDLLSLRVRETWVGGRLVYKRED